MASARSSALMIPASSSSLAPVNRSPAPAASSAKPSRTPPPGATSRGCPVPNPPAGPAYSPGDPPRRPGHPRAAAPDRHPGLGVYPRPGAAPPPTRPRRPAPQPSRRRSAATPPRSASRSTSSGSAESSGVGAPPRALLGLGRCLPWLRLRPATLPTAPYRPSGLLRAGRAASPSASSMGSPATSQPQVGSGWESPGARAPRASFSPGPSSEGAGPRGMHHRPFGRLIYL